MKSHIVVTATKDMPVDIETLKKSITIEHDIEIVPLPFGDMSLAERESHWKRIFLADALLVRTGVIPYELIAQCRQLKIIALHGVGVDQVDVKVATEAGIYVTNVPGGNAQAVAELTFALMLGIVRQVPRAHQLVTQGQWEAARTIGRELGGKRLGIVGLGNIGKRVACIAQAFGMEVVYWDYVARGDDIARLLTIEEVFRTSDIVSVHTSLTDATKGLIGRRLLSLMKKDSYLVNTSRGAVVVEEDLFQALEEGWFAGAALDVFEHEPLLPPNPLLQLRNVLLTPHMAGSTKECLTRIAQVAARDINNILSGNKPEHAVNEPWVL